MRKTLALMAAAAALAGCASGPAPSAAVVPSALQPAGGQRLALVTAATGVQVYECRAKAGAPGEHEWAFVAPEAVLLDRQGAPLGRHYAGPTWEAPDGSKVTASVQARADAPSPEAIPWLLLAARSEGAGVLKGVASIQRVNTVGGMPPRAGCSQATLGRQARVNYSADYHFYTALPAQR